MLTVTIQVQKHLIIMKKLVKTDHMITFFSSQFCRKKQTKIKVICLIRSGITIPATKSILFSATAVYKKLTNYFVRKQSSMQTESNSHPLTSPDIGQLFEFHQKLLVVELHQSPAFVATLLRVGKPESSKPINSMSLCSSAAKPQTWQSTTSFHGWWIPTFIWSSRRETISWSAGRKVFKLGSKYDSVFVGWSSEKEPTASRWTTHVNHKFFSRKWRYRALAHSLWDRHVAQHTCSPAINLTPASVVKERKELHKF